MLNWSRCSHVYPCPRSFHLSLSLIGLMKDGQMAEHENENENERKDQSERQY
jgi:hypothetical protein